MKQDLLENTLSHERKNITRSFFKSSYESYTTIISYSELNFYDFSMTFKVTKKPSFYNSKIQKLVMNRSS